jgi:hypothetical protein
MGEHVVHIGAMINVYTTFVGEPEWKKLHGRKKM